jgi:hypothetical protein
VEDEHDQANDQQNVDKARADVKSQKAEQPENNQNQGDKSKHVLSPKVSARNSGSFVPREERMAAPGKSSRGGILRGVDREVCSVRYRNCVEDACERDLIE